MHYLSFGLAAQAWASGAAIQIAIPDLGIAQQRRLEFGRHLPRRIWGNSAKTSTPVAAKTWQPGPSKKLWSLALD